MSVSSSDLTYRLAVASKRIPLRRVAHRTFGDISEKEVYARILCGEIFVDGERVSDPKRLISADSHVEIRPQRRYVSRGGHKLEAAIDRWSLDVAGRVFLDAGSSAGGFTDCLLRKGARRVYAVDVGNNQLDYSLRTDSRVSVMERTNVMDLSDQMFCPRPEYVVADLSFRSLRGAAPLLLSLASKGTMVALAKPQFEWEHPDGRFDGVIRDRDIVTGILDRLISDLAAQRCPVVHLMCSPILGRKGNTEFLLYFDSQEAAGDLRVELQDALHEAFSG